MTVEQPAESTAPIRIAYTADEAAELCGVPASAVLRARRVGQLVGARVGKRWLFRPDALDAWLSSREEDVRSMPPTRRLASISP